jgi:aspartate 1-decarboxylase
MKIPFLYGKVHRAVVTDACLEYVGSLTLDQELMDAAGFHPNQRIEVLNITNGNRLATYLIPGPRGAGDCCLNGAAAHLCSKGDRVIVVGYCDLEPHEIATHQPKIVLVGAHNTVYQIKREELPFTKQLELEALTVSPSGSSESGTRS